MPRDAVATLAAKRVKRKYHLVAGLDVLHTVADFADHARALVAEDHRCHGGLLVSIHGVVIAMAHARADQAHCHLAGLRRVHLDGLYRHRCASLSEYRCLRFHV